MKYQDFVIRDGKFIGKFDEMYQAFDDPWHQSGEMYYSSLSRRAVCYFIEKFGMKSIVEFGCGLGKTSNYISTNTGIELLGVDISETSIEKCRSRYPDLKFEVNDIEDIAKYSEYQCIFFSEITWYILEDRKLDRIFDEMLSKMKGSYFIHNLVFYKGASQSYGREYFSCMDEFIEYCPFQLLGKMECDLVGENTIETSAVFTI